MTAAVRRHQDVLAPPPRSARTAKRASSSAWAPGRRPCPARASRRGPGGERRLRLVTTVHASPDVDVSPAPMVATYRRRRLVVLLAAGVVAVLLILAAGRAAATFRDVPASVPERRPVPASYVVQPGDTLWSIAQRLDPTGDVRPLVDVLARLNGGADLAVGQQLVVP